MAAVRQDAPKPAVGKALLFCFFVVRAVKHRRKNRAALHFHVDYFGLENSMKVLMVLTSHSRLGNTGKLTGFWLEEFAAPYYVFKDAGVNVTIASPLGGPPPLDPKSDELSAQTDATRRFRLDLQALGELANSLKLKDVFATEFDAVFYPGGHGPMWDLTENAFSIELIQVMIETKKIVAAICHGPAVLRHVKNSDGTAAVKNRRVTGFSNTEEKAAGLSDVVPFLVEDMLKHEGGQYSKAADWQPHVVSDGLLITGQNPASSQSAAAMVLEKIRANSARF
jgi:putative intracellular protease/amidase